MLDHLKALLILTAFAGLVTLGTPGLDYQKWQEFDEAHERDDTLAAFGPFWGRINIALAKFNGGVRAPIYQRIEVVQRPLRMRQSWHLYRDGPKRVRRMEIRIDGQLVHRSGDRDHAWRSPQLRNRRFRPMVENVCRKTNTPNWRGFTRWVVTAALEDFPEAETVRLSCTSARFPGDQASERHFYLATAPDWIAREENRRDDGQRK